MAIPFTGSKGSIGGTALALLGAPALFLAGVQIKAAHANTGQVYVGLANTVTANSAAATDGYELSAGEEVFIPAAALADSALTIDAANIYVIASAASQKVFFIGV